MSEETNFILPISTCRNMLQAIQDTLESVCPQEPSRLMTRLTDLSSLLATSAQVLSSYQFHVDTARLMAVQEAKKAGYSGNMAKEFCEGTIAEVRSEMKLAERQNAAIAHNIEAARSILSYTKSELYHSNSQSH